MPAYAQLVTYAQSSCTPQRANIIKSSVPLPPLVLPTRPRFVRFVRNVHGGSRRGTVRVLAVRGEFRLSAPLSFISPGRIATDETDPDVTFGVFAYTRIPSTTVRWRTRRATHGTQHDSGEGDANLEDGRMRESRISTFTEPHPLTYTSGDRYTSHRGSPVCSQFQ